MTDLIFLTHDGGLSQRCSGKGCDPTGSRGTELPWWRFASWASSLFFSFFYSNLIKDPDSFPLFLPEQFPVWALPLWSWDAPLLWSRARLCTTVLTFPSSCSQPEMHRITSMLKKDEHTPSVLSAGGNILTLASHLAFQHNAALWGHLITQILNKVWTWSKHGRERGKI